MVKINLSPDEISGYNSIGYKTNIDDFCSDGEADEIICYIDYVNPVKLVDFIVHLKNKVSIKGKLVIYGTDLIEVCNNVLTERINSEDAIKAIYGDSSRPAKKMMMSLDKLALLISNMGLKVIKTRLSGVDMVVEAVRQ